MADNSEKKVDEAVKGGISNVAGADKGESSKSARTSTKDAPVFPKVGTSGLTNDTKQVFTAAETSLLETLFEVNGRDAYSNEAQAMGRLGKNEWLVLPIGFVPPKVDATDVGRPVTTAKFTLKQIAEIYALNKEAAPTGTDAIKFGMIRMEAVKMGWVDGQKEVVVKNPPADAVKTLLADLAGFDTSIAQEAAYLVPLAAEHTFRTTGHHYLTGMAADYDRKYDQIFRACLAEKVKSYLPPAVLFHSALHWVSPGRVWEVVLAKAGRDDLPEAISLRQKAAPAGTAIITTMTAVIAQFEATAVMDELRALNITDMDRIKAMSDKIKADPPKYHKVPQAYGRTALSAPDKAELDAVAEEARKLAPVAQGFIEAMFKDSALGRAKVFKKHADESPMTTRRAKNYFLAVLKAKVVSVDDIFAGSATTAAKEARKVVDAKLRALEKGAASRFRAARTVAEEEDIEEEE